MIDIRKLKELVRLMVANDLTELDLRDTEEQVTLRRDGREIQPVAVAGSAPAAVAAAPVVVAPAAAATTTLVPDDDAGLVAIECPMVGTFYTASNPDTPAFVTVGSTVDAESVVCIVEAMKIFNEIKAECNGTIARVCVENGASVEFGQPLFMIKPD